MKRQRDSDLASFSQAEIADVSRKIKKAMKAKQGKIELATLVSYFLVYCGWPLSFYLSFMYFNPLLKSQFRYTAEDIIFHNFLLSILLCIANSVWAVLIYRIYPLTILRIRGFLFLLFSLVLPFFLQTATNLIIIFTLQALILILTLGGIPGDSIFIRHFPVLKRFTVTSFLYALTRAIMYIITSFGLVYLTEY